MAVNQQPLLDLKKRFAIDSTGRLVLLYDDSRDCVLGQLDVRSMEKPYQPLKSATCPVIKGDTDEKSNILRLIGIED